MAKKWSEVAASPQYQKLSDSEKEAARSQYFDEVVAPKVPKDQLGDVRAAFDADTGSKAKSGDTVAPAPKKMGWLDRVGTGLMDTVVGFNQALANVVPIPAVSRYENDYVANREKGLAADGVTKSDPARITGQVINPLNYLPLAKGIEGAGALTRIGQSAATGAFSGALQPVTGGDYGIEKSKQIGLGTAVGGGFGALAEGISKAAMPVLEPLVNYVRGIHGEDATKNAATQEVLRRIGQDAAGGGPTAQDMLDLLHSAPHKPQALVDVAGENVRALAGRVAREPGPARNEVKNALIGRDKAAGSRLAGDIDTSISSGGTAHATHKALSEARAKAAAPLYEKAFEGRSLAPLQGQLEAQYQQATEKLGRLEDRVSKPGWAPPEPRSKPSAQSRTASPSATEPGAGRVLGKKLNRNPANLFDLLAQKGGIKDQGGELRGMDLHKAGSGGWRPGFGPLIRKNGMTLDRAREVAEQAGYIDTGKSVADFLDLIDHHARFGSRPVPEMEDVERELSHRGGGDDRLIQLREQMREALAVPQSERGDSWHEAMHDIESELNQAHEEFAASTPVEAQKMLRAAKEEQRAIADRMRRAQADGSANVPGAVWSPRIQQFLDDPIVREGFAKGIRVQRLAALKSGTKFNPSEYAITGFEEDGTPKIAAVPNMKTLDFIKGSLDDMVEKYRNPVTGRLVLDREGREIDGVRKAFIREADRLNPDYKKARDAYAGPSQMKDALSFGQDALKMKPEEIGDRLKTMTKGELESAKLGLADALKEKLSKTSAGGDESKRLTGNEYIQKQILPFFASDEEFGKFISSVEAEQRMFASKHAVLGGSDTARRMAEDGAAESEAFAHAGAAGDHLVGGNTLGALGRLARAAASLSHRNDPELNLQIAKLLTAPVLERNGEAGMKLLQNFAAGMPTTRNYLSQGIGRAIPFGAPMVANSANALAGFGNGQ